jgi:hypothetical protein
LALTGNMDGSDEGMRLSPTKARFQPEDRGATFDACHTLCDVFDEKFEVFGGVCASEKTDGILIVRLSLPDSQNCRVCKFRGGNWLRCFQ